MVYRPSSTVFHWKREICMTKKHTVILQPSGRRGQVDEGTSVRAAARELGVEIESICAENATCGKCMVLVEEGRFEKYNIDSKREHLSPVEPEERAYLDAQTQVIEGQRLGNRTGPFIVPVQGAGRCADQCPRRKPRQQADRPQERAGTGDRDQAIHPKILCLDDAAKSRTSHCRLGTPRKGTRNIDGARPPRRGESAALV